MTDEGQHPVPASGSGTEFVSRPRDDERPTRAPMSWWDRLKFLVLMFGLWWFFVWAELADNPLLPFSEALRITARSKWPLYALAVLEFVRQIHYLLSEGLPGYHRFWTQRVFGGFERRAGRLRDWTRFRVARVVKIVIFIVVAAIVLGRLFDVSPWLAIFELPRRLYVALPLVLQLAFGFFFVMFQFIGLFWFLSRGGIDVYYPDDIKTRFSDVWGQDAVVERVKENMLFLEEPKKIEEHGGYVPGGLLLWGPPGCGKTLMAEAVAGETGKPYVFVDPGAFINMFMGVGILKVKSLFRKLRKLALRYGGVIVFFDEADSLGNRGMGVAGGWASVAHEHAGHCHGLSYLSEASASALWGLRFQAGGEAEAERRERVIMGGMAGGGGGMGTLQALLTELSGLKKPRGLVNRYVRRLLGMRPKPPPKYRILVMMATNMPDALDPALLRPGRIDRIYRVGYPAKNGRVRTYEGYLRKVSHELTPEQVDKLATMTPYATGASIKDLVNEALINAIREGREVVTWPDILHARHVKRLGPSRDVELVARDRHSIAVHEACHAVVAYRVRRHLEIDIATIDPGNDYLGLVGSIRVEDRFSHFRTEYEADIMCSLASLAGERLFFDGDSGSGVSGDLESATDLAILMEGFWGMGQTIASHAVTQRVGIGGGGPPRKRDEKERDLLEGGLGHRIEENLARLMRHTEALLRAERTTVLCLAHALETHKTLSGEDVVAVIEGRPGVAIDGRQYRDPTFVALIEAYHTAMLAAHKAGQAEVQVPLPVHNELADVPALVGAAVEAEVVEEPGGDGARSLDAPAREPDAPVAPVDDPEGA